jgi:hypothetical protein
LTVVAIRWLTPDQVAERLNVKRRQLAYWRQFGGGPQFVRWGPKTVRYAIEAVEQFEREGAVAGDPS